LDYPISISISKYTLSNNYYKVYSNWILINNLSGRVLQLWKIWRRWYRQWRGEGREWCKKYRWEESRRG